VNRKTNRIKILLTGAGALLGQGIIKSLRMSSLDCEIIGADPHPLAAGLYRSDKACLLPMADSPNFLGELLRIARSECVDAVLVGTDVELGILAAHRAEIEAEVGAKVLVSSPEVIAIANDKWKTYLFLKEHGFPYPESCLASDLEDFLSRVPFPLVVKPRVGARSVGKTLVANRKQLEWALETLENPIIQECLLPESEEYTVGTLVFDGKCLAVVPMKRELRDGNTFRAYVDDYPAIVEAIQPIATALNPYGPANFQLRYTKNGATVFEINGRFSGTTPFRAVMGFNEVEAALRHILFGQTIPPPRCRKGIVLRYLNEMVISFEAYQTLAQDGKLQNPESHPLDAF